MPDIEQAVSETPRTRRVTTARYCGGAPSRSRRRRSKSSRSDKLALLLFRIGEEWYSVGVADVREIFQEYDLTPIPCVPPFISGVINVRGEILSVTDPAKLMGVGAIAMDGETCPPAIVFIRDDIASAVIVDEIGDIAEVESGSVEPPVSIIDRAHGEFIAGSVYVNGTMVGLVNVEKMLEPIGAAVARH